ncbi:winged helix-turn-helix transcriptional regulator [archaeon]|nr:winged helix-turn-helix transcriptional regulator [archaeon]
MDHGELLTESKWRIIKELANQNQTPTDLAKKAGTSLANVSQQLRLLEAYGLVKREGKVNNNVPGKPKTTFSLGKEVIHITFVSEHLSTKKDLDLDFIQKAIINLWLSVKKDEVYFLEKFFVLNEELIKKCHTIAVVKSETEQIDLMLITPHVQEIRDKYSNAKITNIEGKTKNIVCWTHTIEEVEAGIRNHEKYFLDLTKDIKPFMDQGGLVKKIKAIRNEKNI